MIKLFNPSGIDDLAQKVRARAPDTDVWLMSEEVFKTVETIHAHDRLSEWAGLASLGLTVGIEEKP